MNFSKYKIGLFLLCSLVLFVGCAKQSVAVQSDEKTSTTQVSVELEDNVEKEEDMLPVYFSILSKTLEESDNIMGETSTKNEEEAFDYSKQNIRVWQERGTISQVLILNPEVNLQGIHVGDSMEEIKAVFGDPTQDTNGEMHFTYGASQFIVVQYDTTTDESVAIYLLSEDYGEGYELQ